MHDVDNLSLVSKEPSETRNVRVQSFKVCVMIHW